MKSKPDLNKYDKKTLELQKETIVIQNRAEKNVTGHFHKGYFQFLFTRTHFAYFNNTAKSKRKKINTGYV